MTARPSCAGCGVALRGRQWICKGCIDAAERAFTAAHPFTDPDSHIRNRNRAFGSRDSLLALVQAGRDLAAA
jgi:hypothetical protein